MAKKLYNVADEIKENSELMIVLKQLEKGKKKDKKRLMEDLMNL